MKAKKYVLSTFLVLILLLSTVFLFACGKTQNGTNSFKAIHSLMTEMEKDTSLFSAKEINGVSTKFYLNDFYTKNSEGGQVAEYNYYIALASESFSFINDNYMQLNKLEAKQDFKGLEESIKSLKNCYNKMALRHANLVANAEGLEYHVYDGYFSEYRQQAKNFVNQSYDCALKMADILYHGANLAKSMLNDKAMLTVEGYKFYCDYNLLKIFDDYRKFFMTSCKGDNLEENLFVAQRITDLGEWQSINPENFSLPTEELRPQLREIFNRVNSDRGLAKKAMNEFSYHTFVNEKLSSLNAYTKSNADAHAYYDRLEAYFADNGTLAHLKTYLENNCM